MRSCSIACCERRRERLFLTRLHHGPARPGQLFKFAAATDGPDE
jgi:hypothetical protein